MIPRPVTGSFEVYEWCLRRDGFSIEDIAQTFGFDLDRSKEIVENLLELHLIRAAPRRESWFLPEDPDVAYSQVLTPRELDLLERKVAIGHLRTDLARLSLLFRSSKFAGQAANAVETVKLPEAVKSLLSEATANASREVVFMRPETERPAAEREEEQAKDFQLLERGVQLRILYQHTARFDLPTREHAENLLAAGAEIRTAGALFSRLTIFDRATAFIPSSDDEDGALVVQEHSLIKFLQSCFEHAWATAKKFDTGRAQIDAISQETKKEIVKMLISGAKDEAIARRLGVSVRTCRKHIGQLMLMFGATSRFQFGYLVKEANLEEDV